MGPINWKHYGKLSQYKCVAKVDTAILTEAVLNCRIIAAAFVISATVNYSATQRQTLPR